MVKNKWLSRIKCIILIVLILILTIIISCIVKDNFFNNNKIISADAFYCNSCYVTKGGELYFVGLDEDKVFGESTIITKPIKINTGSHVVKKAVCSLKTILYLDELGDVYTVGSYVTKDGENKQTKIPIKVEGIKDIVDIDAGEMHYMALSKNGDVWCWGKNECRQVSPRISESTFWKPYKIDIKNVKKIQCGYYTSSVITNNDVILWGENSFQLNDNEIFKDYYNLNIKKVKDISIGRNHIIVQTDKSFIGFGSNYFGQLGEDDSEYLQGETIDIELEKIDSFCCGYTSSSFLSDGEIYSFGEINPFDGKNQHTAFKLVESNSSLSRVVGKGFHIVAYGDNGIVFKGNNDWGQCAEKICQNEKNIMTNSIALVDTGVYSDELFSDCGNDSNAEKANIISYNLKNGNNQIFNNAYDDSHGTAMMSLIMGCKFKNKKICDYNRSVKILPIKAISSNGARFIDIITALRIAKAKGCKVINCSFSITDFSYESILKIVIKDMKKVLFVFADKNDDKEIITVNSENVIYVTENNKLNNVNYVKLPKRKYRVLLPFGQISDFEGTSCATAYVSGIIARKFIDSENIMGSLKEYIKENVNNEKKE